MSVRSDPICVLPSPSYVETEVPYTPTGLIGEGIAGEEERLLELVRDSRLLDVFTQLACHSLQSPVRTDVPGLGRVETDEVYVGFEKHQARYVLAVQATAPGEPLNLVRVGQDLAMCRAKLPALVPRALGAQAMEPNLIALFEFRDTREGIRIAEERHYRLVSPDQLTTDELQAYRSRLE